MILSKPLLFKEDKMKVLILMALMISLAGCSNISARLQPALSPASGMGNNVICKAGCKDEWQRAQLWIVKHSKWKIQTATDVSIQTYNPVGHDVSYGFSVTKEPMGADTFVINIEMVCGNALGCDPKPYDVKRAFLYYVKTGEDLLLGKGYLGSIR
jgi:hypothetical protein